jgi:Fe-S-cluster containining protein
VNFECQRCGACCCNVAENLTSGFEHYVPIEDPRSKLLTDASLRKKLVSRDNEGDPHMRMLAGRCAALLGRVGDRVRCRVYAHRPRVCRRVQPGDPDCLRARLEHGL